MRHDLTLNALYLHASPARLRIEGVAAGDPGTDGDVRGTEQPREKSIDAGIYVDVVVVAFQPEGHQPRAPPVSFGLDPHLTQVVRADVDGAAIRVDEESPARLDRYGLLEPLLRPQRFGQPSALVLGHGSSMAGS